MSDEQFELGNLVLIRVPPGDRWQNAENFLQYDSLIDGLNAIFEERNQTDFVLRAKEGRVYLMNTKNAPPPPPPKKLSIYGDR